MVNLLYKELTQIRTYLLQILGFLALAVVVLGRASPSFTMSYLQVMPVVFAMTLPQVIFEQEERGNTFVFLRALPIRPAEIVAAKYAVSVLLTAGFLAIIILAGATGLVEQGATLATLSTVGFASLALSGVSFFLHFWLGSKPAKVALILFTFVVGLFLMLAMGNRGDFGRSLGDRMTRLGELAATPLGACLFIAGGFVILGAGYLASARIFTKRDLSRLP